MNKKYKEILKQPTLKTYNGLVEMKTALIAIKSNLDYQSNETYNCIKNIDNMITMLKNLDIQPQKETSCNLNGKFDTTKSASGVKTVSVSLNKDKFTNVEYNTSLELDHESESMISHKPKGSYDNTKEGSTPTPVDEIMKKIGKAVENRLNKYHSDGVDNIDNNEEKETLEDIGKSIKKIAIILTDKQNENPLYDHKKIKICGMRIEGIDDLVYSWLRELRENTKSVKELLEIFDITNNYRFIRNMTITDGDDNDK